MAIPGKSSFQQENDINILENQLGRLLSYKQANPAFVQQLRRRLTTAPSVQLEKRNQYKAYLIIAAALFSGGLIIFIASILFGRSNRPLA
ncbi:MAG: hypothetical protein GX577_00655 [Leptolinea sp.]|nr:hypothetical protein [Leptolinea sp.]